MTHTRLFTFQHKTGNATDWTPAPKVYRTQRGALKAALRWDADTDAPTLTRVVELIPQGSGRVVVPVQ